ncbi:hypothetical protein VP01_1411g2 [Puccinia sorghi]|uniref:Uncharacterized protein n=1 Tax=Puccinia sorghi TaxID=27349 RepID=A0A0L6VMN3_9BASI|nr:hypothetical protein VP01_1411g2 [Puccinia sorghi]
MPPAVQLPNPLGALPVRFAPAAPSGTTLVRPILLRCPLATTLSLPLTKPNKSLEDTFLRLLVRLSFPRIPPSAAATASPIKTPHRQDGRRAWMGDRATSDDAGVGAAGLEVAADNGWQNQRGIWCRYPLKLEILAAPPLSSSPHICMHKTFISRGGSYPVVRHSGESYIITRGGSYDIGGNYIQWLGCSITRGGRLSWILLQHWRSRRGGSRGKRGEEGSMGGEAQTPKSWVEDFLDAQPLLNRAWNSHAGLHSLYCIVHVMFGGSMWKVQQYMQRHAGFTEKKTCSTACMQLTCSMPQPSCLQTKHVCICIFFGAVTNGWSSNRSLLGLSACQCRQLSKFICSGCTAFIASNICESAGLAQPFFNYTWKNLDCGFGNMTKDHLRLYTDSEEPFLVYHKSLQVIQGLQQHISRQLFINNFVWNSLCSSGISISLEGHILCVSPCPVKQIKWKFNHWQHSGKNIAIILMKLLKEYYTKTFLHKITANNALKILTLSQAIEHKLNFTYDSNNPLLGCMAHIIMFAIRNGLSIFGTMFVACIHGLSNIRTLPQVQKNFHSFINLAQKSTDAPDPPDSNDDSAPKDGQSPQKNKPKH